MNWSAPEKPAEFAENRLIEAILSRHFPIDSALPAERELATQLGVTRPTLREALQRLARDGWLEIQQGKSTRIRNYWQEGNLGVLSALARFANYQPDNFIPNLLFIRVLMAPSYTRLSIENSPEEVADILYKHITLPDSEQAYASFDWDLHHQLTILSGNPIFTLILNGFRELYYPMACQYFQLESARSSSKTFYAHLYQVAISPNPQKAEQITRKVMQQSLALWAQTLDQKKIHSDRKLN
jgi:GntR family transcriptional regulator, negative regulator for fad regulon and positive regulator of fabA